MICPLPELVKCPLFGQSRVEPWSREVTMLYAAAAVERAMKIQQVIVRALSGAITWLHAADILGLDPRSVRRWRARYEAGGPVALYDRRRVRPARRQSPAPEVQRILRLYRERFIGWNVRHFYRFARRDHAVTLSYSFVKLALQEAGSCARAGRAAGTGGDASPAPALASCRIWTAAPMSGSAAVLTSAKCSSRSWTTPPSACSTRSSGPPRRRPRCAAPSMPFARRGDCPSPSIPTGPAGPFTPPRRVGPSIARIPRRSAVPSSASASSTS